jgi:hypothetical protein
LRSISGEAYLSYSYGTGYSKAFAYSFYFVNYNWVILPFLSISFGQVVLLQQALSLKRKDGSMDRVFISEAARMLSFR